MYLGEKAWPALGSYFETKSLALIPIGSTEQHGPQLPSATDHLIAESLAREAADQAGYLSTPTINVGVSSHHRQFHGTMWVTPPVFRDYIESLTRNLAYHGIDRVIFVNAHGGNVTHLREVGRRLREEETLYAIEWMWDESIKDTIDELFVNTGPHGGPKETSLVQYLAKDLVRDENLSKARDGGVVDITTNDTIVNGARTYYDAIDNTENGVVGDQTEATEKKGERLFEEATEQLIRLCDWLADQEFSDLMPEPHV
jgi:creatinine amidohydrolase